MTIDEHNRTLGILHIVYGALHVLLMLLFFGFFGALIGSVGAADKNAPPLAFFALFFALFAFFALLYTIPSFVAGYALLKRKPWARIAGIIAAIIETMNVPFGTALGVYALWFLFGEGGRAYEQGYALPPGARYSLSDAPPQPAREWAKPAEQEERAHVYAPPRQPPDWRGE